MDSPDIFTEEVIPLRFGKKGNVIVCKRVGLDINEISRRLESVVVDASDEEHLVANEVYAFNVLGTQKWSRCIVKFVRRSDNVNVLQLVDETGIHDFDAKWNRVRKISCEEIKNERFAEFKLMVYGIGIYFLDDEFSLVFNQLLKDQQVMAIFTLLEPKEFRVHECFVGDLLYNFRSKFLSFRELLIKEWISYPSKSMTVINQLLFRKRTEFLALRNGGKTTLTTNQAQTANCSDPDAVIIGNRYHLIKLIGEGSFGAVFLASDKQNGSDIAMKLFKSTLFGNDCGMEQHIEEAEMIAKFDHSNVISLLNVVKNSDLVALVFPWCPKTLEHEIYESEHFEPNRVKLVMLMILKGLAHIHECNVIHRDLKPANILLDINGVVKIADFGLAKALQPGQFATSYCGTRSYMPPEVFQNRGYNTAMDIWAVGCILGEMFLKRVFVTGHMDQLKIIYSLFSRDLSAIITNRDVLGLIKSLMCLNPTQRLNAAQALEHSYFK